LKDSNSIRKKFPAYDYMVYLRHYGFPSPLLDWSTSPYVAAYFAFRDCLSKAKSVAIFAYIEHEGIKSGWATAPGITALGSNIRSDVRHFLQQSNYTICTEGEGIEAFYCSHDKVFSRNNNLQTAPRQDLLWKFVLPSSERGKAIKKLDLYNINAYSLFQSNESLMETVFLRDFFR
jgi:FRG domain